MTKIADIKKAVADAFGITIEDLGGPDSSKKYSFPRHIAFYLCRNYTEASFPMIAREFGHRDHTTVISGIDQIKKSMEAHEKLTDLIQKFDEADEAERIRAGLTPGPEASQLAKV